MAKWILLFGLAVLCCACGHGELVKFECPRESRSSYICINRFLIERVRSDSVEANVEAAAQWLSALTAGPMGFLERQTRRVEKLKTYVGSGKISASNQCSPGATKILEANDRLTGGRGRCNCTGLNRMEVVVANAVTRRAIDCEFECIRRFHALMHQLDSRV